MDRDLEGLSARCDFCDASYQNLRKELQTYLNKKKDIGAPTDALVALFKNVASTEPNSEMQSTIFAMAAQYESFRSYLNTYAECEEQTAMIIDEARLFVVSPLRDVLVDAKQALAQKPNKKIAGGVPLEQYRYNLAQEQLPEHAKLFEKHRLGYLKGVLKNLVYSELKYHCRVIEELTPLLALLSDDTSATVDAETLVHFS